MVDALRLDIFCCLTRRSDYCIVLYSPPLRRVGYEATYRNRRGGIRAALKLLLFIVACILITIPERQAVANDLSLTARVEGGIDPATLAALQTLPTVWRPQLAKIVDDTMTRVDVSVKSY
jgi:hypothetical protein